MTHQSSIEDVGNDGLFGVLPSAHVVANLLDVFVAEVMGTVRVDATKTERLTDAGRGEVERLQDSQDRRATETQ
jgi:hypothetical protein